MKPKSSKNRGIVQVCIGIVLFVFVMIIQAGTPSYNQGDEFELVTKALPWIALLFIAMGVIDIIVAVVGESYSNKTVTSVETPQTPAIVQCENCGLRVSAETKICPKCRREIMHRR